MASTKQITLLYEYDDNWIGGAYYIHNIIKALNLLSDEEKPSLLILHDKDSSIQAIKDFGYPYISFGEFTMQLSLYKKAINRFFFTLFGKRPYRHEFEGNTGENVYPLWPGRRYRNFKKGYYWIPDFQEYYLPHFFAKTEVSLRKKSHHELIRKQYPIIFSSETALNDFNKFYPDNNNCKKVLRFASFINDDYKKIPIDELKWKFGITKPYFIVPNQFWKHKNHPVVLQALVFLKEKLPEFQVIFTGKEFDSRNSEYSQTLREFVAANELQQNVLFLGFIDRKEQLQLLANAISIIQPSLFEGWSTVVEDSKVLNQFILVSDINIHREQIKENCMFFNPHMPEELAEKMKILLETEKKIKPVDYLKQQQLFAKEFNRLF